MCDRSPADIALSREPLGRPICSIDLELGPSVSLSHDDTLLVVAVSRLGLIGVDLEPIARASIAYEGRREFLHPDEVEVAESSDDPPDCALRFWTQKEAYLKATGTGFLVDPRKVSLVAGARPANTVDWTIRTVSVENRWLLSVAHADGPPTAFPLVRSPLPW